jgi:hypothetical protein
LGIKGEGIHGGWRRGRNGEKGRKRKGLKGRWQDGRGDIRKEMVYTYHGGG